MALDAGELFERYHGVVFRRCLALLRHPDDAAEAVQEVFERALAGLGRFRLGAAPLTWLYAIATRHCLQRLRNDRARALRLTLLRPDPPPGDRATELAARSDLDRALAALSTEDHALAVYVLRDGLTQDEIGQLFRLSRKTVGRRIRRVCGRLAIALDADAPAEAPTVAPNRTAAVG